MEKYIEGNKAAWEEAFDKRDLSEWIFKMEKWDRTINWKLTGERKEL